MTRKDAYVMAGALFLVMFIVVTYGLTKALLEDESAPMRTETVDKVTSQPRSPEKRDELTGKATLYWHCGDKVCSSR